MDPLCPLRHLAEAIRLGSPTAEDAFVREARRRLVRMAEDRLRGNRMRRYVDPDDIAQIVVLTVCKRILRKEGGAPVGNWNALLRMLTEHAIADSARSLRRELNCVVSMSNGWAEMADWEDVAVSRSNSLRWEELEQRCLEIESLLPAHFRKVWCMRREGVSWNEIGTSQGCNGHALRVRFNAWLKKVAEKQAR